MLSFNSSKSHFCWITILGLFLALFIPNTLFAQADFINNCQSQACMEMRSEYYEPAINEDGIMTGYEENFQEAPAAEVVNPELYSERLRGQEAFDAPSKTHDFVSDGSGNVRQSAVEPKGDESTSNTGNTTNEGGAGRNQASETKTEANKDAERNNLSEDENDPQGGEDKTASKNDPDNKDAKKDDPNAEDEDPRQAKKEDPKKEDPRKEDPNQNGKAPGNGGAQAQQPPPPQPKPDRIFEEERSGEQQRIISLQLECQGLARQVDAQCGPANPIMQQAARSLQVLNNISGGADIQAVCKRYSEAMQGSQQYMNQYVGNCSERKVSCHNSCSQLVGALNDKDRYCHMQGWQCQEPVGQRMAGAQQDGQACGAHQETLAKAKADMQTIGTSGGMGETCNKMVLTADSKASGEGAGAGGGNTANASLDEAQKDGEGEDDKFDLYSDTLRPVNQAFIPSVKSNPTKTNYQKKGGSGGPQLGSGGSPQAGYAGDPSQSSAGRGGNNGSGGGGYGGAGGVIQGYGGRPPGGGSGSGSYGNGGGGAGSGSGSYARGNRGSASAMTAAEAAKYKKGMKLSDYLPGGSRDPQALKIAAYQKRDGITGPTGPTIWTKVSNRYRIHEGSLLPP